MAYSRVEETFWHDPKVRALSNRGRVFFLYLLTCPHRNRLGCFVLDPFYAAADLQWDPEDVNRATIELEIAGRIEWDAEHRVVLVKNFLKHNTLENPQVVKGATRELSALPATPLLRHVHDALDAHSKAHYRPLLKEIAARVERLEQARANDTANGSEGVAAQGESNRMANDNVNGLPIPLSVVRCPLPSSSSGSSLRSEPGASADVENSA